MTTPEKLEAERKAFEEAAKNWICLDVDGQGNYRHFTAQCCWETWQVARSQPQQSDSARSVVSESDFLALYQAYVGILESARSRIVSLGGECDPVDVMERSDLGLFNARIVLESIAPSHQCKNFGQTDIGQTGEYPCDACGLPLTHDDVTPAKQEPIPSDDELPGMWEAADFTGGDPDERSHNERTRAPAPPFATDSVKDEELAWREQQMKAVWDYLNPNASNDMEWSDEIIIAIDQRSTQPAQTNAAAEDSLRAILKDRNHRTDGDLNALIDRLAHMCAGDRDYIAMNEKWHVQNASQSNVLTQKVEAIVATIGKHLAVDAGFESASDLQKYLYGVMKYLDRMTNDHGGNDLPSVPTSASSEYIAGFQAGAHATRLDQQPSVPDYKPTNDEVHAWRDRNDMDMFRLEDCRTAIDDARSMHLIAEHGKGGA